MSSLAASLAKVSTASILRFCHLVKAVVEDCRVLDSFRWTREGIPRDGADSGGWEWHDAETGEVLGSIGYIVDASSECPHVLLRYTLANPNETVAYHVPVLSTRPNYGGVKRWFGRPACGRRVRKLYLPKGSGTSLAGQCYRLAHEIQRQDDEGRARDKARKIRLRLGGSRYLLEPFPAIPKGMWWRSYHRFRAEATAAEWKEIRFSQRRIDTLCQK